MKIIKDGDFYRAYHPKGGIKDIFNKNKSIFNSKNILIATLDSNMDLKEYTGVLQSKGVHCALIGKSCLLFSDSVEKVFYDGNTFNSFDEIYLLNDSEVSKISEIRFPPIRDEVSFDKEEITGWKENMEELGADLFFSDGIGCGINFGGKNLALVKKIGEELESL